MRLGHSLTTCKAINVSVHRYNLGIFVIFCVLVVFMIKGSSRFGGSLLTHCKSPGNLRYGHTELYFNITDQPDMVSLEVDPHTPRCFCMDYDNNPRAMHCRHGHFFHLPISFYLLWAGWHLALVQKST